MSTARTFVAVNATRVKGKSLQLAVVEEAERNFFVGAASFDLFHKLFFHSHQGAALADAGGKILLSNASFVRLVLQAPLPIDLQALLLEDGAADQPVERMVDTGKGTVRMSLLPLAANNTGARWLWLVSPGRDTRAREKLISLKNLYRSFIDNTFELVFRTSENDRVVFSNRLFVLSFGFDSYAKAKGHPVEDVFQNPDVYHSLKERLRREKKINHETVLFKRSTGQPLTGLVNAQYYLDEKGEPTYNWTVLDISDRMEYEERLKAQNDQLAKVNHQMEKFLYSTSHDLRSPLTTILGLVNLLRMETKDGTVLDYVAKIETSATRLDKIIRDIMTFSRAAYQRLKSERIAFEPLIWKTLNNYHGDPALRKVSIEVKVKGEFHFYTDTERIEIILDNILRNSLQFYDSNKARPFIRVHIEISDALAHLEFVDNGIGIGIQHLDHIFNMFYKASHMSRGAGLGLYMVKEAVAQLHGEIQVESEIGFGSRFRITLPNDHKGKLINRKMLLQQVAGSG